MITLGPVAERQVADLLEHYARLGRHATGDNLINAIELASKTIERAPLRGLAAPRLYPALRRPGLAWLKTGRYWIAYSVASPMQIVAVFYETADIPGRL